MTRKTPHYTVCEDDDCIICGSYWEEKEMIAFDWRMFRRAKLEAGEWYEADEGGQQALSAFE